MPKKKHIFIIFILLILFIRLTFETDYTKYINSNWKIKIPKKAKIQEIYSKTDEVNVLGDGVRYHIFSYKEEKYIKNLFEWTDKEKEIRHYSSYNEAITSWLEEINVPKEKYPNYTESLYWHDAQEDDSQIIIVWSKQENKLYIIESFL